MATDAPTAAADEPPRPYETEPDKYVRSQSCMALRFVGSKQEATEGEAFDVMAPANIAPAVVWLGSDQSADVTGCVFELEGGKIMIEDGWREGPMIDKGARWNPADVGEAVHSLLEQRVEPRKVWGT